MFSSTHNHDHVGQSGNQRIDRPSGPNGVHPLFSSDTGFHMSQRTREAPRCSGPEFLFNWGTAKRKRWPIHKLGSIIDCVSKLYAHWALGATEAWHLVTSSNDYRLGRQGFVSILGSTLSSTWLLIIPHLYAAEYHWRWTGNNDADQSFWRHKSYACWG